MKAVISYKDNYFKNVEILKTKKEINLEFQNEKFQKIMGFGGAFPQSSGFLYSKMSQKNKEKFVNLYFSKEGLNYNLGRLTIGSCDFSNEIYDYIENGDLSTFSLKYEEKYLFPLLSDVFKVKKLFLIASSWSAPKEFKETNDKNHGGFLKNEKYEDYAKYLSLYLVKMKERGYEINALNVQNEPLATQTWESMILNPLQEKELILKINENLKKYDCSVDFYIYDHNKDKLNYRCTDVLKDEKYRKLIKGVSYHWYDVNFTDELRVFHENFPEKTILFTEGCIELLVDKTNDKFLYAMRYAKDYINDLLNFSNGFIDWNLVLDMKGGPNHVGNFCGSLIQYNEEKDELIVNPSYYIVKHFSHFLSDEFYRFGIINKTKAKIGFFMNEKGKNVLIIVNFNEDEEVVFEIEKERFSINSLKNSVITIEI